MSDAAPAVERWLAWRYLATRQREGFVSFIAIFSLIGVALGVATLIVVLSVMGGFRQQLLGRIIGMNGHIVITARDGMVQATPELLAKLKDFPGVRSVRLTLERQALVAANGQTRGASLRGVRPEDLLSREIVTRNIVHGDLEGPATLTFEGDQRESRAHAAWTLEMMQRPMRIAARVAYPLLRWGHDRVVDATVDGLRRQIVGEGGR